VDAGIAMVTGLLDLHMVLIALLSAPHAMWQLNRPQRAIVQHVTLLVTQACARSSLVMLVLKLNLSPVSPAIVHVTSPSRNARPMLTAMMDCTAMV
jgi:hypothetical protein